MGKMMVVLAELVLLETPSIPGVYKSLQSGIKKQLSRTETFKLCETLGLLFL